ncbi:lipopolysaccharide assembly protein LapB [Marmoricola sp. URHB0036]|uniref:tetratricopeptide repeat protein n=1 Tax=Marmoricola sp. URHB0036 TaxID=1298863 RepID=UPI000427314D|nr:hypothetical protein [Marmoricola sp. URHB0036]
MNEPIEEIQDQIEEWESHLDGEEFEKTLLAKFGSLRRGEPGRAELLCSLAERRLSRGDPVQAREWFERAVDEPGEVIIDPRCGVLQCCLALEAGEEVSALERDLRRASASGDWRGAFHEHIGETFELAGQLERALRWFTMGVRDLDLMVKEPTTSELICLNGRRRVRRKLDKPLDAFDVYTDEEGAHGQERHD